MRNIKNVIKKILPKKILYNCFLVFQKIKSKKNMKSIKKEISKRYYRVYGNRLNWKNPIKYSEKMNISKVMFPTEIKSELTDKYLVRNWIKKQIGEQYLIPLIGVYNSFDEIDFDKLPNKFVIKCNHDSSSVTIVKDKNTINYKKLKTKYDYYMKRNYAFVSYEMHYKDIKPLILIEKYMGDSLKDYKFLCFNGKPYYCWVDFDRFNNHKRNIYDMNWILQEFNQMNYGNYEKKVLKPKNFDKMIKIVTFLSKNFNHVRVDLYEIDNRIYFGEMTFTNGSGLEKITPDSYDCLLGSLWKNIN